MHGGSACVRADLAVGRVKGKRVVRTCWPSFYGKTDGREIVLFRRREELIVEQKERKKEKRKTKTFISPGFRRVGGHDRVDPQLVGQILECLHGRSFHLVIVCHCRCFLFARAR